MNSETHTKDMRESFLTAYDAYADAIYRHCFFRVFSHGRAEELMQETFIKTWEYIEEGKSIENIRAFLYRVANNLIVDESRKKKEASLEETLEALPHLEPRDEGQDPTTRMMFLEVMEKLQSLPEDARKLIIMRYIDDLSPREIADTLGITPNNVSVKLHRAIEMARGIIHKTDE